MGDQWVDTDPDGTAVYPDHYEVVASTADRAILERVAALADAEQCYITRSRVFRCADYIGGTFLNGSEWVEAMCCLPCRLDVALGLTSTLPALPAPAPTEPTERTAP